MSVIYHNLVEIRICSARADGPTYVTQLFGARSSHSFNHPGLFTGLLQVQLLTAKIESRSLIISIMRWTTTPFAFLALVCPITALIRFQCSQLVVERLDPLVTPGQVPSPHVHQIVGGNSFNATMAPSKDMPAESTCTTCQFSEDFRYKPLPLIVGNRKIDDLQ